MKRLILLTIPLCILFPLLSFSQTSNDNNPFDLPIDSTNGKVSFAKIIETGKTKSEIYTNIKSWIIENYDSPNQVIKIDDKESGIILLKSFFQNAEVVDGDNKTYTFKTNYYYSLKIIVRDSKYKIAISDIEQQGVSKYTSSGYSGDKSPVENALLINKESESYIKYHEARQKLASLLKNHFNNMISSIEEHDVGF